MTFSFDIGPVSHQGQSSSGKGRGVERSRPEGGGGPGGPGGAGGPGGPGRPGGPSGGGGRPEHGGLTKDEFKSVLKKLGIADAQTERVVGKVDDALARIAEGNQLSHSAVRDAVGAVLESEGIDVTKFESVVDAQRLKRESVSDGNGGRSPLPRVEIGSDGWPRLYA